MNAEKPRPDQSYVLKGLLLGVFHIHTPGPGKSVSGQGIATPHCMRLYNQESLASRRMLYVCGYNVLMITDLCI